MANDWTPPSDAVETNSSFVPPSDAVEVKKKRPTASGSAVPSSERLSKTTTKPTASSSSAGRADGLYSFPGQENATYKKENGQWSVAFDGSYKYIPLQKGDVQARVANLEKNAVSLEQYGFETKPRKEEQPKYTAAPKPKPIAKPQTEAQKKEQQLFETEFKALDLNDPEYLRRKAKSEKIDQLLAPVTGDLIDYNEGNVVPVIDNIIKQYPYLEVSESGIGYDELKIVNKVTGEKAIINLDNWTSGRDEEEAKQLRAFLDVQINSKDYVAQKQKVDALQAQMQDATPTQRIDLSQQLLEEKAKLNDLSGARYNYAKNDKYKAAAIYDKNAAENIKTEYAKLQLKSIDYAEKVKSYNDWSQKVNEAREKGLITEEQYETEYAPKLQAEKNMLNDERFQINESFNQVRSDSTSIDNIAASEYAIQAEKGNVLSGATYSFLEGAESSLRFLLETGDFKDGEFKGFLTQAAPGSISNVYTSAESRNVFEQIIFGLANSGGSALVSAASGSTLLGLYASSYVNMKDQMSTPQFKDVPEYQKILMSGIYGATIGYLENKGIGKWFQKTPAGKGLTNWILKKTISELGKDATAETIELTIKKNLGAAIKNGLIQVTASGLVEGSTELAQEATDIVYKEVFNIMSEKKYFENPTSWTDVADRLGKSFVLGFAGAAGMQSITQATQVGMNELDKNQINNLTELIDNPELKNVFKLNLKDQILSGQISKQEAQRQIFKINEIEGALNKIPSNVDKFQAFKLINERDAIQKEIAGKDPALVAAQTERVNAINDELKQLSYAVQEQATSEVPVQPGAAVSGEVAQGEPETGSQKVTKEGEQEEIVDLPSTQNVGVLITPATVRNFSEETGRLKELSLEYDTLVKEYSATKNPDTWAKVKQIESEILDNAQKEIEADVAQMPGVEVEFGKPRMGLWDGKFEPSFNMNLKISEDSDTTATSEMLINFAEKYSQDAFILETDSDLDTEVSSNNIDVPYTEFDGDGMMHYPQISYTFANNLSDQQIADLSNKLQDSGITAFSLNDQELKISVITFLEDNLSEDEQFTRKEQEFRDKLDSSADAIENVLGDNGVYEQAVTIKRSSYQGAKNEGSSDQTRQYDRGDVLKPISKKEQSVADLSKKLSKGRILQADTKDATNLQKALDALDKIEKDLDKFGKETLGVNIPVALAKTIVKAVKALVKAGVTLEQAIKQIAAEYNLSDRDVKSLLTPTKVSEIDVNEVRAKARPGKRISKGLSVKTVAGKKVIEETEDLSLDYVKKNAPKVFVSNANIIAKYPLVAGKKKFKTATTVEQAQEIYDVFVREVADNLNYLMAEFKPEYREISTLWYDGANAIANDFADQFGVSAEQAAGIIAAMSPQKDWYQNVRLAEMVLMAYRDNPVMTKEMIDYQKGINKIGLYEGAVSPGKKLKKAEAEYKKSRTKANKEVLDQAKNKLQEAIEKADALVAMLETHIGKNLNDVPAFVQPYMVRTYHEVNTTKDYNIVAPDGSVQGVAKKKDGSKAKVAWGSYSEIGKAVSIKNDGSQENITRSLGEMHKIRNFYNNIIDPMSKDGDVTMDTHAIAAALLLPLSGNSTQVGQNFGTGTANSAPLGIKGLYYAYADAYDLSAKEAGLLPRQVQSITWEAIRGLYTDTFKSNKTEVAKINNIWKDYQDGKITIDEAREQAKESAGGIKDPTWAGPVQAELGEGAGTQGVEGGRGGNERDTVGGTDGGGVLTADTKDKTNLKKALDVLNKADDDLAKFGRETLGINIPVATMRAIIKLAKVLVKTGITLQDAIIQAAEQKNVSKKDALNAIKFMVETINKPVEKVTVNKVTALKDQIRLEARAAREGAKSVSQAVKAITAFFKDKANQVNLTRAELKSVINIISSVKDQKTLDAAADKIYKIVSSAKSDVIEVNQMQALKSQIRLEAKAAREAKGDLNAKRKALAAAITGMVRQGKITALQARSIINKVSKVNLDNPVMVDRLISYAERVFDRADYQETLSKAAKIRKSIKKAMKSKDLQAEVAGMAKKFSGVDPFMVEDIDQYIENAEKVLNAVRPVRDTAVPLRQAVDIEAISEYTTAQFERQEANKKAELLALNKYLVDAGIVTDDMTAKEIQEMIDIIAAEDYEVEDAAKKLIFLKSRFNFMAGVIEEMIVNNRDIFTDEALDLTQSQRDLMRKVLKFDIDKLSVKQAAQVLEAMDNFINNGITSGLEAVVNNYIGNENANKLAESGLKSRPLKMYWNKAVGRFFGEQFVSLPLLIERMFPGMKKGLRFMSEMGLTDVIRGVAKADREHKMIVKDYTSQEFSKGKGFMKAENVYERGMIAFLSRNLAGTKTEMRNEFLRRIKMIEESINSLMTGSETERKMGEAYQKIYDKLKVNSQDLDVIKANAEQMNLDAVDWMTQQWAEKYSDLSDISLSVYNAILGSDTNYTPDRYKALDEVDIELDENLLQKGSAFMGGLEYTDKNKSGVLIETTRPKALPKGRFVSLDFDVNNFSSLKGAMIDIETAPAIRQVDGFIKSDGYKKMVNGDDRKILTRRINNYIISVKGKTSFNRDSMKSVERLANFLGSLGVGKALGGLDQTIKQTAPVIINTLINAGRFDGLNMEMNEAINRSGMPIANRGIEAVSGVESVDALIDKKGATAAEIAKAIEKVSQMYMKALLSKPDVWVARSSFISYYKNYLKNNSMSTNIDWKSHEWNQDALNYAQMMVDRQQNISDEKLAGSFMSSTDSWKSVTRKVMLPFATFIINQKNRMHNDFVALFGRGAETSLEDRKRAARSLIGLSAEMLAYQAIAYFIKTQIYDNFANWITGEDDEEEKKERSFFGIKMTKKQWNATKFPVKSLISDVLSPFPLFDDAVVFGFDEFMSNFPMISDEDIKQAIQDQNDARMLKGGEPMDAEQEANFVKALKSKNTYAVTFQNESLGRQYGVPGIAIETYIELAEMSRLAYTGEFEDDMGYGPKLKHISKSDQEIVKWTLLPMMMYSTGLLPKDAGVVSRKVVNTIKKRAISDTKFKNVGYLKEELGRKPKEWEESLVMNTTKKIPTLVEAIKFAERFGGLTESQGKEFAKLIELTGDYGYMDLKRIQDNETADQILKK